MCVCVCVTPCAAVRAAAAQATLRTRGEAGRGDAFVDILLRPPPATVARLRCLATSYVATS